MTQAYASTTHARGENRLPGVQVVERRHLLQTVARCVQVDTRVTAKPDPASVALRHFEVDGTAIQKNLIARTGDEPFLTAVVQSAGVENVHNRPAAGIEAHERNLPAWSVEPGLRCPAHKIDAYEAVARRAAARELGRHRISWVDLREPRKATAYCFDKGNLWQLTEGARGWVHQPDAIWKLLDGPIEDKVDAQRIEVRHVEAHRLHGHGDVEHPVSRFRDVDDMHHGPIRFRWIPCRVGVEGTIWRRLARTYWHPPVLGSVIERRPGEGQAARQRGACGRGQNPVLVVGGHDSAWIRGESRRRERHEASLEVPERGRANDGQPAREVDCRQRNVGAWARDRRNRLRRRDCRSFDLLAGGLRARGHDQGEDHHVTPHHLVPTLPAMERFEAIKT